MSALKGFIHINIDLPYQFAKRGNDKTMRFLFRRACRQLFTQLLIDNNLSLSDVGAKNFFPGLWKSKFLYMGNNIEEYPIEIKERNKYFVAGKHWFNIENFQFISAVGQLTFTKVGVKDDRKLINELYMTDGGNHIREREQMKLKRPV